MLDFPLGRGGKAIIWGFFLEKLHENGKNWVEGEESALTLIPPPQDPTVEPVCPFAQILSVLIPQRLDKSRVWTEIKHWYDDSPKWTQCYLFFSNVVYIGPWDFFGRFDEL